MTVLYRKAANVEIEHKGQLNFGFKISSNITAGLLTQYIYRCLRTAEAVGVLLSTKMER